MSMLSREARRLRAVITSVEELNSSCVSRLQCANKSGQLKGVPRSSHIMPHMGGNVPLSDVSRLSFHTSPLHSVDATKSSSEKKESQAQHPLVGFRQLHTEFLQQIPGFNLRKAYSIRNLRAMLIYLQNEVLPLRRNPGAIYVRGNLNLPENASENRAKIGKMESQSKQHERTRQLNQEKFYLVYKSAASQLGFLTLPDAPKQLLYVRSRSRLQRNAALGEKSTEHMKKASHHLNKGDVATSDATTCKRRRHPPANKNGVHVYVSYLVATRLALLGKTTPLLALYTQLTEIYSLSQKQKELFVRAILLAHICSSDTSLQMEAWHIFLYCFGKLDRVNGELLEQIKLVKESKENPTNFEGRVDWFQYLQLENRIAITDQVVDALLLLNFETGEDQIKHKDIYQWCAKYNIRPSYHTVNYIRMVQKKATSIQFRALRTFIIVLIVYIFIRYKLYMPNPEYIDMDALRITKSLKNLTEKNQE